MQKKRSHRSPSHRAAKPARSSSGRLTHFNAAGEAHMVGVGSKAVTERRAVAEGAILMQPQTLALILEGGHKKGDVLGVARIAGIQAAKRTAELVPLCHPIMLTAIDVAFASRPTPASIQCQVTVSTLAQTGVEMEALTAVGVALLTIYDMCKAVDRGMTLTDVRLREKSGGASGHWVRE